jgi:Tol biopolymer transport system component/DNA-binding winged helix-turn-helix (wHTH) protein
LDQFKLKHLWVDVPRCQIIDRAKTTSVEPRSMDVLAFLAAHPRQVISQQALFDALWPDTLFSPGAIQRCIAQLRKAMGDDARSPIFISTHSKRGYCLDVVPSSGQTTLTKGHIKKGSWLVVGLLVVVWLYFNQQVIKQDSDKGTLTGKLTPITSTSDYDFFPSYSSDGKTLAFIRQIKGQGHIYLKDMETGKERQLTQDVNNYLSIVWSEDNRSILFIVRGQNSDWVGNQSIDEDQAKEVFRLEGAGNIWRVFPKENGLYYMLANAAVNKKPITKIRHFSLKTNIHTDVLVSSDEFTAYRLAMSPDQKSLAIGGESPENKVEFRLLDLQGYKLSKPFATLPLGFTEINWHPDGKTLLVHHLNELLTLSLDGEFTSLAYNNYQRIFNPVYHPDGLKIVLSLTERDTDLATFNPRTGQLDKFIDSDGEDHLASFSPNGQSIAFVSSRLGIQQLFISGKGHDISLFSNPDNLPIYRAPVWSKQGDKLAFSFANNLFIYSVNTKNLSKIVMPATFTSVLDWFVDGSRLLIATKKENVSYFSQYDLDNQTTIDMVETGVNYSARLSNTDKLVFYKDGILHWGTREFLLNALPPILGSVYPMGDELIFQSGRQIIRFDGNRYNVMIEELPQEGLSIADIHNAETLLLNSSSSHSAKIVALE